MTDDTIINKWPSTLIEMMECNRRTLAAAGISEAQARELGYQLTRAYARDFGGCQHYIPKGDQLERAIRDEQIYAEYRQGNAALLARKYNLTEAQIYSIYKTQYKLHTRKIQTSLF